MNRNVTKIKGSIKVPKQYEQQTNSIKKDNNIKNMEIKENEIRIKR